MTTSKDIGRAASKLAGAAEALEETAIEAHERRTANADDVLPTLRRQAGEMREKLAEFDKLVK